MTGTTGDFIPTDRFVANELLPPLEIAREEFFLDMAFDERLLARLEVESNVRHFETSGITTQISEAYASLFPPNTTLNEAVQLVADGPLVDVPLAAFAFRANGTISADMHGRIDINVAIGPIVSDNVTAVRIETSKEHADTFFMYEQKSEDELRELSTLDVAILSMQIAGLDASAQRQLVNSVGKDVTSFPFYRSLIAGLWNNMSERDGMVKKVTTIIQDINEDGVKNPLKAKLLYEQHETAEESRIKLTFERSIEHTEFDVDEAYVLELVYVLDKELITSDAIKIIQTGIQPQALRSGQLSKMGNGRRTKLDLRDETIMDLFVDTFDELLSA